MRVADVMNPHPITVGPETTLRDIAQIMLRFHLNDVLVVEGEALVGIVTYKDIFEKLLPDYPEVTAHATHWTDPDAIEERLLAVARIPAKDIMTRHLVTVSPKDPAMRAGSLMNCRRVKQLPVLENGRLVGIVSYTDITWGLVQRYYKGTFYRRSSQ